MNKKNLIICTSSYNNYEMLEKEVFNNINLEGFEFINVDDKSTESEIKYGKLICKKRNIIFLENKKKGVQHAVDTIVNFILHNRPKCKWIVLFQHDNYPLTKQFFNRLSHLIDKGIPDDISALGFNHLDRGEYTYNALNRYKKGKNPIGILGKCHLSIKHQKKRWAAPRPNFFFTELPFFRDYLKKFKKPFSIEIPLESAVALRVSDWVKHIKPTSEYHFHLWLPDVMMQFLSKNKHCVILPKMYCMNDQYMKEKYGINKCSAAGAKNGEVQHFGEYSNFEAWRDRWGWDYTTLEGFSEKKYKNTLINEFYNFDLIKSKKPLKIFDLEY